MATETESSDRRRALLFLGVATAAWSSLCAGLHSAGHSPTGPTPLDNWYGIQAFLVWAIVPLQGLLVGRLAAWRSGADAAGRWAGTLGFSSAVLFLVATDVLAWALVGFNQLGSVLRFTAPGALGIGLAIGAWQLHRHGPTWLRSLAAMLLGLLAAGLVGGPFLR